METRPSSRQRVIASAAELFHRRGYRRTSIEDILIESSVSRSNLYYHFTNKADLAEAVVVHWTSVYDNELIAPSLGSDLPPIDRLEEMYRLAAATQAPPSGLAGCPLGQLAVELTSEEPRALARLREYFAGLEDRIAGTLREQFPDSSPERMAHCAGLAVTVLEGGLLLSSLRMRGDEVLNAGLAFTGLLRDS